MSFNYEERRKSRPLRDFFLLLLAIAIAAGTVYLIFRNKIKTHLALKDVAVNCQVISEKHADLLQKKFQDDLCWKTYAKHLPPDLPGRGKPLLTITANFKEAKKPVRGAVGGDYDPGEVLGSLTVKDNALGGKIVFEKSMKYHLPPFKITTGMDENESVQDYVFRKTELTLINREMKHWIRAAAIQSMGQHPDLADAYASLITDELMHINRIRYEAAVNALQALGPAAKNQLPYLRAIRGRVTDTFSRRHETIDKLIEQINNSK